MDAGKLDRLIQFQRASPTDSGLAEEDGAWGNHGSRVWASKQDISDGERWRAQQVGAQVTARFAVRWSPFTAAITTADRLVCEGTAYEITGRKEIGRREGIEFTAVAETDKGSTP